MRRRASLLRQPGASRHESLRRLLVWTGLAVTVLFGYLAVRDVRFDEVQAALRTSAYLWLVPAALLLALSTVAKAIRWQLLYAPEVRPGLWSATSATSIGYFFNNLLPARAGEAARVVVLHQSDGTSRAMTTGTIVVERAYDVLSLLVLLFVSLPWLPSVAWLHAAEVLALVLVVCIGAVVALLLTYGDRPIELALRPLSRLPFVSSERVQHASRNLAAGAAGLTRPRLAVAAFAWSIVSWLVMALSFWLVMIGFDLGLPPSGGLLVLIAVGLSMILPSSPGALGVFEAAIVVALSAYGIEQSLALAYALAAHAMQFAVYLAVGGLALHLHSVTLRRGPAAAPPASAVSPE